MCVEQEKSWRSSPRTRAHYGPHHFGSIRPRFGTLRFLGQPLDRSHSRRSSSWACLMCRNAAACVPGHSRQREYSPLWFESNPGFFSMSRRSALLHSSSSRFFQIIARIRGHWYIGATGGTESPYVILDWRSRPTYLRRGGYLQRATQRLRGAITRYAQRISAAGRLDN
jgi:hypothetical protein